MSKNFDLFFTLIMTALDVHYITVEGENKLRTASITLFSLSELSSAIDQSSRSIRAQEIAQLLFSKKVS